MPERTGILELLDRPIAFHRCFAAVTGSVNAGLMLSQAVYWTRRTSDPDGWFYKSAKEWEDETYLTRREQETARKSLNEMKFWGEKLKGRPATLHYRVDLVELENAIRNFKFSQNVETSSFHKNAKLDSTKTPNKIQQNVETINKETETTTETTTERRAQDPVGIATSILGMIPIYLQETIEAADITQPHLWRKCCEDWKASRYSLRNIPGLIDKYRRAESQDARDKENTINGKNRTYKTSGERAAESTIELARKLAPAGGNGADTAIPGFEWFDAVAGIGNGDLPADLDSNANRNPKRITQGRV